MQTIQLDISSDIFDKVIAFLEILQIQSMSKTWNNREDEAWDEL
jgi:hypothetical protein